MREEKVTGVGDSCIRAVRDIEELGPLRSEWDELAASQKAFFPFLCLDWFRVWLEHFQHEEELLVLLLYRKDRIDAIAPLLTGCERFRGITKARKISLIGNVHSPLRSFIIRDGAMEVRRRSIFQLFSFLRQTWKDWDVMELEYLPEEDGTVRVLEEATREFGYRSRTYKCFQDSYVNGIDCSGEEYLNRLPKKMRNELKRRKKRLSELGDVRIEIGTDAAAFDRHMEVYYSVRDRSWKSPEADREFLYEARRMAAAKGWLRCGFLFLNEVPIAAQIRVVSEEIVYFMEAVHDEAFKKFAPGHILRAELIKHFIDDDGVTEIDQGRGDESYKNDWSLQGRVRERKGMTIFNETTKGRLLALVMTKLLPAVEKSPRLVHIKEEVGKRLRNR